MAASDYSGLGENSPCPVGTLGADIGRGPGATVITISSFQEVEGSSTDIVVGMAILIDDEIMRVDNIDDYPDITVARGCADTIPEEHLTDALVWFFDTSLGSDNIEYISGDTIGVKLSPFTTTNTPVPLEYTPPLELTFDWRFWRPYPPADFKCNGEVWFEGGVRMTGPSDAGIEFTWANRDRVGQADQLIGHTEASVTIETGATYTARVYDDTDTLVATYTGITGTSWTYDRADAIADLPGLFGYVIFCTTRDTLDSLKSYRVDIYVSLGGLGEVLGENLGG